MVYIWYICEHVINRFIIETTVQIQSIYQQIWQELAPYWLVLSHLFPARRPIWMSVILYNNTKPSSEFVPKKMIRWRAHYMAMDRSDWPKSCTRAIKECEERLYPNLRSASNCLHSASHKLWVWTKLQRSRAIEQLHASKYGSMAFTVSGPVTYSLWTKIDLEQVVNMFASLHPRKLELENLIFQ